MTNQEAFDIAVKGIVAQGKPAYDLQLFGGCCYRTSSTPPLKCAIGMFIPDDRYTRDMEGEGPDVLFSDAFDIPELSRLNPQLFAELQDAHDDAALDVEPEDFLSYFLLKAQAVAKAYDLEMPNL
jgi:hypothetical protein